MVSAVRGAESPIDVSFVVPVFQGGEFLNRMLRSLLEQESGLNFEVIVINSGVCDSDTASLSGFNGRVHFETHRERLSAAQARNLGARKAKGDFLAFLDSDVLASKDWLATLYSELQASGARIVGGYVANLNPNSEASRIQHWLEFSESLPGLPSSWRPSLPSCNWLIRRSDFEVHGGFNESLEMSEDLEFCFRLSQGIRFVGKSGVAHRHREEMASVFEHLERLGFWSGRLRRSHEVPGSWLRHAVLLTAFVTMVRWFRIAGRVKRSSESLGDFLRLSRPTWKGLAAWGKGFRDGISSP